MNHPVGTALAFLAPFFMVGIMGITVTLPSAIILFGVGFALALFTEAQ